MKDRDETGLTEGIPEYIQSTQEVFQQIQKLFSQGEAWMLLPITLGYWRNDVSCLLMYDIE